MILEQKHRYHIPNNEIAILYRTNAQSRKFEEHLRRLNLLYRVYGGMSFYQRKEVKDFVAYLRLAVNPKDEEALRRVINLPARGISDATVEKLSARAGASDSTMWDVMDDWNLEVNDRAKKSLTNFRKMVEEWSARAQTEPASKLAADILRRSGLGEMLKGDSSPEGIGRRENVDAVLDAISEFTDNQVLSPEEETSVANSLSAYLQTISLLTDADEKADDGEYITLMSVHAAKGLEYRSIFVTGMEEGLFPSTMSFEDPNGLDEERRLFYVAITRAKEYLTLCFAQNRYRFGQIKVSAPSRFLEEIDQNHFTAVGGFGSARLSNNTGTQPSSSGARVTGNFTQDRLRAQNAAKTAETPVNFEASPESEIKPGLTILHLKFGEGIVKSIEGPKDNRVATISFKNDSMPERRIVLKFAKLQIQG
jgi:DNA helicase-2/ATP-dependent DNA helicase PcrA